MLDFMARTGKRPSELLADLYAKVGPHSYDRLDLSLKPEDRDQVWKKEDARPDTIAGIKVTARDTTDGFRFTLGDKGWRCCASRARSRWSASTPKSLATSRWCQDPRRWTRAYRCLTVCTDNRRQQGTDLP